MEELTYYYGFIRSNGIFSKLIIGAYFKDPDGHMVR